jgi:hypothetical protein
MQDTNGLDTSQPERKRMRLGLPQDAPFATRPRVPRDCTRSSAIPFVIRAVCRPFYIDALGLSEISDRLSLLIDR